MLGCPRLFGNASNSQCNVAIRCAGEMPVQLTYTLDEANVRWRAAAQASVADGQPLSVHSSMAVAHGVSMSAAAMARLAHKIVATEIGLEKSKDAIRLGHIEVTREAQKRSPDTRNSAPS